MFAICFRDPRHSLCAGLLVLAGGLFAHNPHVIGVWIVTCMLVLVDPARIACILCISVQLTRQVLIFGLRGLCPLVDAFPVQPGSFSWYMWTIGWQVLMFVLRVLCPLVDAFPVQHGSTDGLFGFACEVDNDPRVMLVLLQFPCTSLLVKIGAVHAKPHSTSGVYVSATPWATPCGSRSVEAFASTLLKS